MEKLFFNIDTHDCLMDFLNPLVKVKENITVEDIYPFADQFIDKGITDLIFCSFCQSSLTSDSKFVTDLNYKCEQKIEDGHEVDYMEHYLGNYILTRRYGIDPFNVWIERVRASGIRAWLSFRMNDAHYPYSPTCDMRPSLFYTARDNGWMIGQCYGYFKNCLNFAIPEVRNIWYSYIDEQLGKYDVDGIELDFMRELYCFDYLNNPECYKIMNEFIREVRAIIRRHEELRGHSIQFGARLMRDIDQCKIYGFDVRTWEKEGLIDSIAVAPRWNTNDCDMPIKRWKSELPKTEIYAVIEALITPKGARESNASVEAVRGYANRYLSDGVDAMYLFNYYFVPNVMNTERERLRTERAYEAIATVKTLEKVQSHSMRYIVTRQDTVPRGMNGYEPLPIWLDGGDNTARRFNIGRLSENHKVKLFVGFRNGLPSNAIVFVNGKRIDGFERCNPKPTAEFDKPKVPPLCCDSHYVPYETETYAATIPTALDGVYDLSFRANYGEITYLEFYIEP